MDRDRSRRFRERLVQGRSIQHIIVHAGTPKRTRGLRFHVYETPDEYVQSIRDLAAAVEHLSDVHLLVKFRPTPWLSVEDLRAFVPFSERVTLSVEESFLDVLGLADLLVSFSSTTIEEALQNDVPVLLYGGSGRYQHVSAVELKPDLPCPPSAVYFIRRAEDLASGLRKILDLHARLNERSSLFQPFKYEPSERRSLVGILGLRHADERG